MSDGVRSVLTGTAGLSIAALVAAWLAWSRGGAVVGSASLQAAIRIAVVAVACQTAHFMEELWTGFPTRFPALLGLPRWSTAFFVWFNVGWIVIWGVACWGARAGLRLTLFPLWFLGVAALANGVAHPFLALREGGYFPGLATSPLMGLMGGLLLHRLGSATGAEGRR